MRTLVNLNPNNEFRAMEQVFDRLFADAFGDRQAATTMPLDIVERDGRLLVTAAVPGIAPNELEVSIENNVLTIRGESRIESESSDAKVYRREIRYGKVGRSLRLPEGLDLNAVDAEFKNGHVTITLPRLPEEKPKALRVNVRTAEAPSQAIEGNPEA